MAKPFYLACECGGEWRWQHVAGYGTVECTKCQNNTKDMMEIYAAALGVAVDALEQIENNSDERFIIKMAEDALRAIRGKEKTQ